MTFPNGPEATNYWWNAWAHPSIFLPFESQMALAMAIANSQVKSSSQALTAHGQSYLAVNIKSRPIAVGVALSISATGIGRSSTAGDIEHRSISTIINTIVHYSMEHKRDHACVQHLHQRREIKSGKSQNDRKGHTI